MATKKISLDEVDKWFEYDLFIPARLIFMGSYTSDWDGNESGVNHSMAEGFIKSMHVLERMQPAPGLSDEITVIMNNPGGEWYHGMAIYDTIEASSCHVTIRAVGHAMSMGSIILQAADRRIMSPNSRLMIHYGTSGFNNHTKIVQKWAEEDKKICAWMEQLYLSKIQVKHPGFTLKKVREMLSFDTILTAEEAVNLGLADEVG